MKAKVVIEQGRTSIVLTPENDFEIDVIEKVIDKKYQIKKTDVSSDYTYQIHSKHQITIEIEINKETK